MNRDRYLAATAAATTTFTFFTITVIAEHCQFVHGFHLLSFQIEVCLYIEEKNIGQEMVLSKTWVVFSSGANLIINCPQQ